MLSTCGICMLLTQDKCLTAKPSRKHEDGQVGFFRVLYVCKAEVTDSKLPMGFFFSSKVDWIVVYRFQQKVTTNPLPV